MSADESRPQIRRGRQVEKKVLPAGPVRDLRDAIYLLYAEADRPQLETLAQQIAQDDSLPGSPKKDLIGKIIGGDGLASQQDTVTVAVALARAAGRQEIASVAEQVRRLWIIAVTTQPPPPAGRLGRPVGACDPLALEVHPAIQAAGGGTADALPAYVSRAHDARLRQIVDAMLEDGRSRLVTLVGGSSTGKTRAGWELAQYLEGSRPRRWWLWHPYDPTRPQAALADLEKVGRHTIVWLNEAQHYLMPADPVLGEKVAAGLRTLLQDPDRAPVLVLATVWPDYWDTLTIRPSADRPDLYPQARDLLTDTAVIVADAFSRSEIAALNGPGSDARLRQAAEHAEGGRITQYLAGVPQLLRRYRTARRAARAIIEVAMDARRLGHPLALSRALLEQAVPGYLDETTWSTLGGSWPEPLDTALTVLGEPAHGILGPISPVHPRPGDTSVPDGPCYRLADYLEQTGRHERAGVYPPDSLWRALEATVTDPALLRSLAQEAARRARYQHAVWLYTKAADRGDTSAVCVLAEMREAAGDAAGAEALAVQAADRGDTSALRVLAERRMAAGNNAGAEALAVRIPNGGVGSTLWILAKRRVAVGETAAAAEALYQQAADHGNIDALLSLAGMREAAGDIAGAGALYRRAADHGNPVARWILTRRGVAAGDAADDDALAGPAANHGDDTTQRVPARPREGAGNVTDGEASTVRGADHSDPLALGTPARLRNAAGDAAGTETLHEQAAGLNDIDALLSLAVTHPEAAEALAVRAAEHGDPGPMRVLIRLREKAGDTAGAETLYRLAADYGDTAVMWELAERQEKAGDAAGAEALAVRAANYGDTEALRVLARLREAAGNTAGAHRIKAFGLTGSGEIATELDFSS